VFIFTFKNTNGVVVSKLRKIGYLELNILNRFSYL